MANAKFYMKFKDKWVFRFERKTFLTPFAEQNASGFRDSKRKEGKKKAAEKCYRYSCVKSFIF